MVSLAAVGAMAGELWSGQWHDVVTQPDLGKGERLVLLNDSPNADRNALAAHAREQGISAFAVPVVVLKIK